MRMLRAGLVSLTVLIATAGCGPSEAEQQRARDAAASESAAEASASAEASRSAEAEAEEAEEKAEQEAEWQKCLNDTRRLLRTLQEIDSRFDVGLNADELSDRLGDVAVAYNALDIPAMDNKCTLNVGIALEDAYNQYNKSLTKWNDCIEDFDCEVEGTVLAGMRKHWSEASQRLAHVEKVLRSSAAYAKAKELDF